MSIQKNTMNNTIAFVEMLVSLLLFWVAYYIDYGTWICSKDHLILLLCIAFLWPILLKRLDLSKIYKINPHSNITKRGNVATYSFELDLKGIRLSEFPDSFKIKSTLTTINKISFSSEVKCNLVTEPDVAPEHPYIVTELYMPLTTTNVATNTKVVIGFSDPIVFTATSANLVYMLDKEGKYLPTGYDYDEEADELTLTPDTCLEDEFSSHVAYPAQIDDRD